MGLQIKTRPSGLAVAEAPKPLTLHCGVPGCGKEFPMEQRQQFERHIFACVRKNRDVIEEAVAESRSDSFRRVDDVEQYEFLRKRRDPNELHFT